MRSRMRFGMASVWWVGLGWVWFGLAWCVFGSGPVQRSGVVRGCFAFFGPQDGSTKLQAQGSVAEAGQDETRR